MLTCRRVAGYFLSDAAASRQMSSGRRVPRHLSSGRAVSGQFSSRRSVSRQMSSGRRVPRYLPSGRRVSRQMSSGRSLSWRRASRRGVSWHLPSGCSAFLTDAECQGKCRPDKAYNRVVTVVAPRRDCQGTVHCSEDYQTRIWLQAL